MSSSRASSTERTGRLRGLRAAVLVALLVSCGGGSEPAAKLECQPASDEAVAAIRVAVAEKAATLAASPHPSAVRLSADDGLQLIAATVQETPQQQSIAVWVVDAREPTGRPFPVDDDAVRLSGALNSFGNIPAQAIQDAEACQS